MTLNELQLYKSPVVSIDDYCEIESLRHTYWMGCDRETLIENAKTGNMPEEVVQLHGITSTLLNFALGDTYSSMTGQAAVNRDNAAKRGHNVHQDIEQIYELDGDPLTLEGWNLMHYAREKQWIIAANEYIVSDEEFFASAIDLIFIDENGELCIADIKTYGEETSRAKRARVALQCSIYKAMFEHHNPGYSIKHLYEIRLRNKELEVTELNVIPSEAITELKEAYLSNDASYEYKPIPDWYADVEKRLVELMKEKERIDADLDETKKMLMNLMTLDNVPSIKSARLSVSIVKGRTTTTFDDKRYAADHSEAAEAYMVQQMDTKRFLKEHGKDDDVQQYITRKTGEESIRITNK